MPRIGNHQLVFPKPWDISWFETPDARPAFLIRRPAAALMQSRPIEAFLVEKTSTKHGIWVNYNDLTATSLGMVVSRGGYPQMTLIEVGELL